MTAAMALYFCFIKASYSVILKARNKQDMCRKYWVDLL
jgi:hypothetical protein